LPSISKINSYTQKSAKILLAPLDWGLGHATRCIPIVKELISLKCDVIIAATGDQKAILQAEFPFLPFVELPGYEVKYGKNRALTLLKMIGKIPKILIRIKGEKAWLTAFVEQEKPDAVISDNRYGLAHKDVFSVFMTHQLLIRTPFGRGADRLLQRIQYRWLRRFSECWIPDLGKKEALAGELSHPEKLPSIPVRYIGILSRFEKTAARSVDGEKAGVGQTEPNKSCELLILLSGPEPQRTLFEKILLRQLPGYSGKTILVRGLPIPTGSPAPSHPGLTVHDHLPAAELNAVVCGAQLVLSRPGYSSVMDLFKLGKKCIFVPTPGQTEQEYLGHYLEGRRLALSLPQSGFSLTAAIAAAENFPYKTPELGNEDVLQNMIREWLASVTIHGRPIDKG
jgi:predicted glycosyltransferase